MKVLMRALVAVLLGVVFTVVVWVIAIAVWDRLDPAILDCHARESNEMRN
jgi:hypothetical protein